MFKHASAIHTPTNTETILLIAPILPGKAEAWRRFARELTEGRRQEYEASRQRLGIRHERIWISETRRWTLGIVQIEGAAVESALQRLVTADTPFDRWFCQQLRILQEIDLTRLTSETQPTLLFHWCSAPSVPSLSVQALP